MDYISTRGGDYRYSAAQAIRSGLAPDGGLFVPENIPLLSSADILKLMKLDYPDRAANILARFLTDFTEEELKTYTRAAYSEEKFADYPAKVVQLNAYNEKEFMLELWHGPTAAFKDMALQLLPYLMKAAAEKTGENKDICILTATSGDTGKAALEGFKDVPGTRVVVFYPHEGVSKAQYLQMATQEGENCHVVAVEGSFDDTQTGVKEIFNDLSFNERAAEAGYVLSSANSINWGRLVPQIAYYVSVYVDLLNMERLEPAEKFNVVVPTGNFGNILACWYAMRMGIPVGKLICASNRNNVLSDFLRSGVYDANRPFYQTNAPSMDILISSNLERLLFEMTEHNADQVSEWMTDLKEQGSYKLDKRTRNRIQNVFVGGFCDDKGAVRTIRDVYTRTDHVVDTHTAVGFNVYSRYANRSGDKRVVVFVSTASPFKFAAAVSEGVFDHFSQSQTGGSEQALMEYLSAESDLPIPAGLDHLEDRPILHNQVIRRDEMARTVSDLLGLDTAD